ncbi:MAG: chorismate mutase [Nitrospirota bacterium]
MIEGWWRKRLQYCREQVREIDHEILELIGERMKICLEIGEIKKHLDIPVFDPEQEIKVLKDKASLGAAIGLEEDFVTNLMNLMMQYSKKLQNNNRKYKGELELYPQKDEKYVTR